MQRNPYTPGAGFMPAYMAGREKQIADAEGYLESVQMRYPQQSMIYYGLRGVGKTVLLNTIESAADNRNILYTHIEASEKVKFSARIVGAVGRFLHEISAKEAAKDFVRKCTSILKAFTVTYKIDDGTFGVELNQDAYFATGIYADDLTEVFVSLGKACLKSDDTICIFIDEVQYLSAEEIGGLVAAIHRCNQLRLPVLLLCAGLPKILKTIGEARSYSERLFKFEPVGPLNRIESTAAITEPAKDYGVKYSPDAIGRIVELTSGYPYFIQEMCSSVWTLADETKVLSLNDVKHAEPKFFQNLDEGFFAVRYNRCTKGEKDFIIAMVRCGQLPCTISNVAKMMGRTVKSISPCRGQLINKGMIYATSHAEIDFTVPQFSDYIRRINPKLEETLD